MATRNKTIIAILGILLLVNLFSLTSSLSLSDVTANPLEVAPGSSVRISFNIENTFDENIQNVQVALLLTANPSFGIIQDSQFAAESSSVLSFDEIRSDKSKTASFNLIAKPDADAGVYSIPVLVSYLIDNRVINSSPRQELFSVSAVINSKPVFVVTQENSLIMNQKNTISIKITNIGLAKAKFLEVELGVGNYNLLTGNKIYIGDLNSDDYDTASFDIFTKDGSIVNFPVTLKYRDAINQQYAESFSVVSKVYSRNEAISVGLITQSRAGLYIGVVILLIVIWLIWRWIKKRRKKKIKEKER